MTNFSLYKSILFQKLLQTVYKMMLCTLKAILGLEKEIVYLYRPTLYVIDWMRRWRGGYESGFKSIRLESFIQGLNNHFLWILIAKF